MTKSVRHFLDLDQIDKAELRAILERAKKIKAARAGYPKGKVDAGAPLSGYLLAAVFERESTRTRVSFDVGMRQLGGQTIVLSGNDTQLGRGETIADTARVLSRFVDVIMLRTAKHQNLLDMAAHASVPVINGLSDLTHPCQLMADVMTIEEHIGSIVGRRVAWTGDGNNVAASLVHAAVRFDFELVIATPPEFAMPEQVLAWAAEHQGRVTTTTDPKEAVRDADVVITDTFVSMGQTDAAARLKVLAPYQVEAQLMASAKRDAVFLHCLPAHRGEEVSAEVIDGPQSLVWDEAENRLHAQKAVLLWCLEK